MKSISLVAVGVLLTGAAFGGSTATWQGSSDSNWSDPTKWSNGAVPGPEDTASFSSGFDSYSVRITNDVTVGTIKTSLTYPYPPPTMPSDHRYDFPSFCIYGPTNRLTTGAVIWDNGAAASKPLYFDLKELCLGSAPVIPRGGQNVIFLNGIVLTAAGDLVYQYRKAASYTDDKNNSLIYFGGETVMNAADGHDITFDRIVPYGDMSLRTRGTGIVSLKFGDSSTRLTATALEAGSTLVMRGRLNTDTLTLAAGSTLSLTAGVAHVELGTSLAKDAGATIRVEIPADLEDGIYPVFTGAPGNGFVEDYKSLVTLAGDGASSVTLTNLNGSVGILKGTLSIRTPTKNEYVWDGKEETGKWTTSSNWQKSSGDYPKGGSDIAYLRGLETTIVSNDNSSSLYCLKFMDSCGPLTLAGSATMNFQTYGGTGEGYDGAIACSNRFPTVCTVNLLQSNTAFWITQLTDSYLELDSPTEGISKGFTVRGDVRIGCTMRANEGALNSTTMMTILDRGFVSVYQTRTMNFFLNVREGGTFVESSIACTRGQSQPFATSGTFVRYHRIDGHHSVSGGLCCAAMHYYGKGLLETKNTSPGYSWGRCCLAGGLTLIPQTWWTATANDSKNIMTVVAEGPATLGAKGDWCYGVNPDLTSVTSVAADRALRVCEWATLDVDTANPDTGVGQTITFTDPIFAYGPLVKKGVGTLALATSGNVLRDVTLRGGDLAWTAAAAPTFAALTCAGGAIAPPVVDGVCTPATVTSDTDVSLLRVSFPNGKPGEWTTVLKATGGAKLSGLPKQHGCCFRLVEGVDGDELQVFRSGFLMIVR